MLALRCTACRADYAFPSDRSRCLDCGEPLEAELDGLEGAAVRTGFQSLPVRYADFLPWVQGLEDFSLGEGNTPLIRWRSPPDDLSGLSLSLKNEGLNPTWSFKDRGTFTGLCLALQLEYEAVGTVSTGNMAASVAAYARAAGIKAFILVSEGLAQHKIAPIAVYQPELIMVQGDYGRLYSRTLELAERFKVLFINSDAPLRVEGSKTIAFEICEQTAFEVPDYVVVPASSGGNLRGIIKGFEEFRTAGLIETEPRFIAAQASGCAPIVRAWQAGRRSIERIADPQTVAQAIKNPDPPSGNQVLRKLQAKGGLAVEVSDEEILSAQGLMATSGIFGQPAAAVPLAAVRRLHHEGRIEAGARVILVVTGSGLKDPRALESRDLQVVKTHLDDLDSVFG